jgi:Cu+-exporting ATPase
MEQYYEMNLAPRPSRRNKKQKDFAFLDNEDIQKRLLDFSDDGISVIRFYLPAIHCSSCIWLLENLGKLKKGVISVVVLTSPNVPRVITFKEADIGLREVAELLSAIGYEPLISLEDTEKRETKDRSLLINLV